MVKLAVIGAGKWGSALKSALSEKQECLITSPTKRDIKDFVSIEHALKAEFLIFALSTQDSRAWLKKHFKYQGQKILIASKGIEIKTCKFLDEIFLNFVPKKHLCVLSGPSFAAEVLEKLPTALVISGSSKALCKEFAAFFPPYIKAYVDKDVRGAEVCGAYKNVLAIASGISDALKLGNNARASLIARGLVEMQRFGKAFKAKEHTFLGLSGAGDLFLTASSTLSRNYRAGVLLAKGLSLEQIKNELNEVIEGFSTAFAIEKIARQKDIYTPIASEVVQALRGKDVKECLKDLLKS